MDSKTLPKYLIGNVYMLSEGMLYNEWEERLARVNVCKKLLSIAKHGKSRE
jgi:hypothetical protein